MSFVEGVGDEVLLLIAVAFVIALLGLAWLSTNVRPLWGVDSVWLVQMETQPSTRVVQLVQIDERSAAHLEQTQQAQMLHLHEINGGRHEQEAPPLAPVASVVPPTQTESTNPESETASDPVVDVAANEVPLNSVSPSSSANTQIRLKFLDDTQKLVAAWLTQTVGDFKREHFASEVSSGQTVRLIYQGQLLRDDSRSLQSYGVRDESVLHCHVSETPLDRPPATQSSANNPQLHGPMLVDHDTGLGIGRYTGILFGVKFGLLWAFFAMYPQYFDLSSFSSLLLCTVIYLAFVYYSHGYIAVTAPVHGQMPPTTANAATAAAT